MKNSHIAALYIFQFGFLQPLASIFNSQIPIAIFSLFLVFISLTINKFKLRRFVYIVFLCISIFFIVNALILHNYSNDILLLYIEFIAKCFSAILIASMPMDSDELYNAFVKLSIINFLCIFTYPFNNFLDSMNYMRFGYAMLPSVIIFFYHAKKYNFKNFIFATLFTISMVLLLIYGSRGPILSIIILIIIETVTTKRLTSLKKVLLISILIFIIYLLFDLEIILKLIEYLNHNVGINTYSLSKLKTMLVYGIAQSSSGRDLLYKKLIELFLKSPVFGFGVLASKTHIEFTAHNIILQIIVESGIIGLIIWFFIWIRIAKKYIEIRIYDSYSRLVIINLLIAVSIGRLLVSSDMWLRPEYWFLVSLVYNTNILKKEVSKNEENWNFNFSQKY